MNSVTYALCNKPVIGSIMWLTTLCSFPPLFSDKPIQLGTENSMVNTVFEAPVKHNYKFKLNFYFVSTDARINDKVVGDRYAKECKSSFKYKDIPENQRYDLGRPIPFQVIIRRESDNSIVLDKVFESKCLIAHAGNRKTRGFGYVPLEAGKYSIQVINLKKQTGLEQVTSTTLSLTAGRVWK